VERCRDGVGFGGGATELERGRGGGVVVHEAVGEGGGGDLGRERERTPAEGEETRGADEEALVVVAAPDGDVTDGQACRRGPGTGQRREAGGGAGELVVQ
jgi:hypothetical protein